jgi:hypothetical protein
MSLRVRGRSVELLLEVASEEPLEGFMACGGQAESVKAELHRPSDWSGREAAWHELLHEEHCVVLQSGYRGRRCVQLPEDYAVRFN